MKVPKTSKPISDKKPKWLTELWNRKIISPKWFYLEFVWKPNYFQGFQNLLSEISEWKFRKLQNQFGRESEMTRQKICDSSHRAKNARQNVDVRFALPQDEGFEPKSQPENQRRVSKSNWSQKPFPKVKQFRKSIENHNLKAIPKSFSGNSISVLPIYSEFETRKIFTQSDSIWKRPWKS